MAEALLQTLGIRLPIIQAPMAGGPDTPELVAAVGDAGGLGSIGAAYLTPSQIDDAVARVRRLSPAPFAINLFAGGRQAPDPAAAARVQPLLRAFRAELGLGDPPPTATAPAPDPFPAQLEAVLRARPRVFSFTFGAPTRDEVRALQATSIFVVGTATTVEEAESLQALGVDAIVAQGAEAGGHRGTFLGRFEDALVGTVALVPQLVARLRLPVIAAGGLMDGRAIAATMALGAAAAQLGTAFLACPEAGTSAAHRAALGSPATLSTVITRGFSGRPARGIRNRLTDAFEAIAAAPFPAQQELTRELRAAAAAQGRVDLMQLWAGQGAPLARPLPAAALMRALADELAAARSGR